MTLFLFMKKSFIKLSKERLMSTFQRSFHAMGNSGKELLFCCVVLRLLCCVENNGREGREGARWVVGKVVGISRNVDAFVCSLFLLCWF